MTRKQQRCAVAAATVFALFTALFGVASYKSIALVNEPWHAVDYWLAWFSGFTLLGAVVSAVITGIQLSLALGCDINEQ